jgi:hypothetical protein
LADWAELQSDSISEEEDLISVDDFMDDDRTAQTSPDEGHQGNDPLCALHLLPSVQKNTNRDPTHPNYY